MAVVGPGASTRDATLREAGSAAAARARGDRAPRPASPAAAGRRRSTTRSARGATVGIASVYRALDQLVELRLVQRVDFGDGIARFEPALPDGDHHHHLVCDDCGKVEPFSDPSLETRDRQASKRLGYSVDAHEVVLRGECGDCRDAP